MSLERPSILIVEDNFEILNILKSILSKHFNNIFTAENGEIGAHLFAVHEPDLVLTDLNMPVVGGLDFLKRIRLDGNQTPFIMVSSSSDRSDLINAMKLGVTHYVEKPFTVEEVEQAVFKTLEIEIRKNNLPNMIFLFGLESKEVSKQKKFIGLLQAVSAKKILK